MAALSDPDVRLPRLVPAIEVNGNRKLQGVWLSRLGLLDGCR
jgi:hypothetical protein